ncbi:M23 family metallopeptidase [Arthrobacter sp. AD-310]
MAAAGAFAVICALPAAGSATGPDATTEIQPWHGAALGVVGMSGGSAAAGPGLPPSYIPGALPAAIFCDARAAITYPRALVSSSRVPAGTGGVPGPAAGESPVHAIGPTGFGRPRAGYLMAPLAALYPSSPFGFRISPLSGKAGDFHLGQDYAAACGTTVHAADAGVVRAAGWHLWGGGNRVEIDHGNGLITTYNHLDSIAVRSGDQVHAGQTIARVGSTGWSTGCHLHFETILNGRHTSPLGWTLIPLQALSGDGQSGMLSYAPGDGTPAAAPNWIVPGAPVPAGQGSTPRLAAVDTAMPTAAPPLTPSDSGGAVTGEPAAPAGTGEPAATPPGPSEETALPADPAPTSAPTDPPLQATDPPASETPTAGPATEPAPPATEEPSTGSPGPGPSPEAPTPATDPVTPAAPVPPTDPAVPALPAGPAVPALPAGPAVPAAGTKADPTVPAVVDALAKCLLESITGPVLEAAGQSGEGAATNPPCGDLPRDGTDAAQVEASTRPE